MHSQKQKKIVCISDHARFVGGGEHSFLDLTRNLNSAWQPIAIVPFKGDLFKTLGKFNINTHILHFSSLKFHLVFRIFQSGKKFLKLIHKINPDIIYANGSRSALYSGLLRKIHKKKVIWHCRIADNAPMADRLLERLCDRIIVNAKATAKRFHKKFQHKVNIVYNGFDLKWLKDPDVKKPSMLKNSWINILVVARVSKIKRHDIVLSAFEIVAEKYSDSHLILIGATDPLETEWWDYLQERTNKSQFSKRIHWIGHKRDVRPWYKAAKLLVLSSENEAFGRVLIEAMAMGVPVIANSVGGIPEIITDGANGLLTKSCNPENTADCILKLLKDINLRDKLGGEARKRAMHFDLALHLENMTKIFNSLAATDE